MSLLLFLGILLWSGTRGHVLGEERAEGIRMGRFLFFPAVEGAAAHYDNLFRQYTDQVAADVFEIGPDLVWRLPLTRSTFDLVWQPRLRFYQDEIIEDLTTSVFAANFNLVFQNGSEFHVEEIFDRGILEFQNFAGGETVFAGQRFVNNQFVMGYTMPVGARNEIDAGVYFLRVKFDEREGARFLDSASRGGSLSWNYRMTPDLSWATDLRLGDNDLASNPVLTFDLTTGDPVLIEDVLAVQANEGSLLTGLAGKVGQWMNTSTAAGYGVMTFGDAVGSDYRGLVVQSDTQFFAGRSLQFQLRLQRRPYRSAFNVANYFVNENVGLWLQWQTLQRLTLVVGGIRQRNSYKDPIVTDLDGNPLTGRDPFGNDVLPNPAAGFEAGVVRTDHITRFEARVEFAFIPDRFSIYARYLDEARTSNVAFGEFESGVAAVGLRFGWFAP